MVVRIRPYKKEMQNYILDGGKALGEMKKVSALSSLAHRSLL